MHVLHRSVEPALDSGHFNFIKISCILLSFRHLTCHRVLVQAVDPVVHDPCLADNLCDSPDCALTEITEILYVIGDRE